MKMLRRPEVLSKVGCHTTTLYWLMHNEGFPQPAKLGRASIWSDEEIDEWLKWKLAKRPPVGNEVAR
jgi:predicted DNA-binding transcriptional regulator AlpA